MEYTITSTKWNGETSDEFVERFEGTPQEIAELLRLTVGMNEASFGKYEKDKTFKLDDIEEFKKGEMAVHCKTKELAEEFLDKLYSLGFLWYSKDYSDLRWIYYNEATCYSCVEDNYLNFGRIAFHKEKGHKIKEFKGWQ